MKTSPAIFALILVAAGCSRHVAGSGRVLSETRPISGISAVSLDGVGDVTIVQGETESLVVEAEDNILPLIRTQTAGSLLEISEKGSIEPKEPIRFKLTVDRLTRLVVSGAGTVRSTAFTSPGLLDVRVEGAGKVDLAQLECASVKLVLAGAGDVKLQGHTGNQHVEIAGAAKYTSGDLRTQATEVTINGAGSAKVWAIDTLDVNISGVGQVDYYGNPEIKRRIDGVGTLHSLGDKPR